MSNLFVFEVFVPAREQNPAAQTKKLLSEENSLLYTFYYARVTLPERRQRVQTFTRFTSPSTTARTVCTLGFHAALV
jgi:hypothetical protein